VSKSSFELWSNYVIEYTEVEIDHFLKSQMCDI